MWRDKSRPVGAGIVAVILLASVLGMPGEAAAARYGSDLPASFTLSVVADEVVPCPNADEPVGTEVVTISVEDDVAVLTSLFFYDSAPSYKKPDSGDFRLTDYDEKGNFLVWRKVETRRLSTPEGDQALKLYRLFRVSPDGKVTPEEAVHTQLLKTTSSARSGVSDIDLFVLALGQGYSRYLAGGSAQKDASGALKVRSAGGLKGGDEGIWDLTFALENDKLVREASFTGRQEYSVLNVRTVDVAEVEGAFLATRGEVRLGDPTESYGFTVELKSFSAGADAKLIEETRAQFAKDLVKGNEILDMTGTEIVREFVGDVVPVPTETPCCVCKTVNRTFSECGHLQASVRCASDWCITNVMTSATCANVAPSGVASCPIVSPVPIQPEVVQTPSLLPNGGCPTGGNAVVYATLFTTYDGCNGCTPTAGTNHKTACDVAACPAGASLDRCAVPRGIRRACA